MSFEQFHLDPAILSGIEAVGYTTPTPIQQQAIPAVMEGRDLLGLAQTGNGKTDDKTVCMLKGEKPFIVNGANWDMISLLYGGDDDNWSGHWITLYHDPTVTFGGKMVGGIRIRPDKPTPELAAAVGVAAVASDAEDIPF